MPQSQEALAVSLRVLSCPFGSQFPKPADRASALQPNCVSTLVPRRCPKSIEEGIQHFDVRKIGGYWAYFFISEETNRREMLVEDLVSCAYQKSHSAAFTNGTLLHCAQNLPQYQFARDRSKVRSSSEARRCTNPTACISTRARLSLWRR
jgi:hypothetical protein